MKEKDKVLIIKPFWGVDKKYIGTLGILVQKPTKITLGVVLIDEGNKNIYIEVNGCVPVSSLLKELF